MVDSPFHYFSRLAEDRVNINESIDLDNAFNREYTASFNVNSNSIDWGTPLIYASDSNFDWYGGCSKCYQFSMLFGSSPNNIGIITDDEDFEKYKMQFVEHYNEKHKDLHEWRKNKKGKKPITSKKNIARLQSRIPFNHSGFMTSGFDLAANSNISFITVDEGAANSVFYSNGIPEITAEDKVILEKVKRKGEIKNDDLMRIDKKYGKSLIEDAMRKYRKSLLTRRLIRSGWRD